MLAKQLDYLEQRRKVSIMSLLSLTDSQQIRDAAALEININAKSIENYIGRIYEEGFRLLPEMGMDLQAYEKSEIYKLIFNRMDAHMSRLEQIKKDVRENNFSPELSSLRVSKIK